MSDQASPDTVRPGSGDPAVVTTHLQPNAIGLLGATMQAITHIAPAIAALFFTQFVVSLAGITAPLAYLLGVIVVLMLGSTLVQLSKHMPRGNERWILTAGASLGETGGEEDARAEHAA
jgi:hypothetical protein